MLPPRQERKRSPRVLPAPPVLALLGTIALALLLLHAAYFLWIGVDRPALDYYAFRQTQTALSAYWLWKDGFRLIYETPVVGFPWSIPFEFPTYQWLVALLREIGVPIDIGARLISFGFYIAILYPLWILTKALNLGTLTWLVIAILFLASPFYVYWSRTVMIESCALFFGVSMLAFAARYLNSGGGDDLALTFLAGSLAVLTKATTFPAFAFLAGILVLAKGFADFRQGRLSALRMRQLVSVLGTLAVSLAIGLVWIWYTDRVKAENPFGAHLTSAETAPFTFGTWEQRISADFWVKAIWDRALPEIFGYGFLVAVIVAATALPSRRYGALTLAALTAFVLPFLLFTNLHLVHTYYQNANALLGIAAVGLGIAAIAERGQPLLAGILLAVIVAGQLAFFNAQYAPVIEADLTQDPLYIISQAAKQYVPANQSLLVLGQDWSSAIPYYSERKSLTLPSWMVSQQALDDPEKFLGGQKLGGIVYCTTYGYIDKAPMVDAAVAGRAVISESGPCKLLAPTR